MDQAPGPPRLRAAGFLPEVWVPDAATERRRRLAARRSQIVRQRTRLKNELQSILHAHLIPPCPHADLGGLSGRRWLCAQPLPADEQQAVERALRELDRLADDLEVLDREIAEDALTDASVQRLRGAASAYNNKTLRNQEKAIAEQAEQAYVRVVGSLKTRVRERLTPAGHR